MAVVSVCKAELPSVAGAAEMGFSGCVVAGRAEVMGMAVDMVAVVEGPAVECLDIVEADTTDTILSGLLLRRRL